MQYRLKKDIPYHKAGEVFEEGKEPLAGNDLAPFVITGKIENFSEWFEKVPETMSLGDTIAKFIQEGKSLEITHNGKSYKAVQFDLTYKVENGYLYPVEDDMFRRWTNDDMKEFSTWAFKQAGVWMEDSGSELLEEFKKRK